MHCVPVWLCAIKIEVADVGFFLLKSIRFISRFKFRPSDLPLGSEVHKSSSFFKRSTKNFLELNKLNDSCKWRRCRSSLKVKTRERWRYQTWP